MHLNEVVLGKRLQLLEGFISNPYFAHFIGSNEANEVQQASRQLLTLPIQSVNDFFTREQGFGELAARMKLRERVEEELRSLREAKKATADGANSNESTSSGDSGPVISE